MIYIIITILICVILGLIFNPAIHITKEKDVLLFYGEMDNRKYIKLFRL